MHRAAHNIAKNGNSLYVLLHIHYILFSFGVSRNSKTAHIHTKKKLWNIPNIYKFIMLWSCAGREEGEWARMEFYFNNSNQQPKMNWNLATAAMHFLLLLLLFFVYLLICTFFLESWAFSVKGKRFCVRIEGIRKILFSTSPLLRSDVPCNVMINFRL